MFKKENNMKFQKTMLLAGIFMVSGYCLNLNGYTHHFINASPTHTIKVIVVGVREHIPSLKEVFKKAEPGHCETEKFSLEPGRGHTFDSDCWKLTIWATVPKTGASKTYDYDAIPIPLVSKRTKTIVETGHFGKIIRISTSSEQ